MKSQSLDLTFPEIVEADIPELTAVMTRAFDDDAQKHLGQEKGGPPGYDDGEFFRTWLLGYEESIGFKIVADGQAVGAIIVWILPGGHNVLGTIFVDPPFQDRGIGQRTWRHIEAAYPEAVSWSLATPTWATKNHHFYQKCGFSVVDSDPIIPAEEGTTIYRKERFEG
jgi:GNAT superfamily N-acetyltransferase